MSKFCAKHQRIHKCEYNTSGYQAEENENKLKERVAKLKGKKNMKSSLNNKNKIQSLINDAKRKNEDAKKNNPYKSSLKTQISKNLSETEHDKTIEERISNLKERVKGKSTTRNKRKPKEIKLIKITEKTISATKAIALFKQKQQG